MDAFMGSRVLLGRNVASLVENMGKVNTEAASNATTPPIDPASLTRAVDAARNNTISLGGLGGGSFVPEPSSADLPVTAANFPLPTTIDPSTILVNPNILTPRPLPFPFPPLEIDREVLRTSAGGSTTNLAQSAIALLAAATPDSLQRAFNSISGRTTPDGLRELIERRTQHEEVFRELTEGWKSTTREDFANLFGFAPTQDQWPVMDNITSLAILNDPLLEAKLRRENTAPPTQNDLLENRRIVWQSVQPGTVLQWPYLILVAVEHTDLRPAQDVVQTLLGGLTTYQGYKLPAVARQKLA